MVKGKTLKVTLLAAITLQGMELAAGETVELSEMSAKALVNEGTATAGDVAPKGEDAPPATDPKKDEADQVEKQRKALDAQYKADDLKDKAKEAGVDFAYDVTKSDLIAAIIEQGKTEALLK